jgi:hypothetical protein
VRSWDADVEASGIFLPRTTPWKSGANVHRTCCHALAALAFSGILFHATSGLAEVPPPESSDTARASDQPPSGPSTEGSDGSGSAAPPRVTPLPVTDANQRAAELFRDAEARYGAGDVVGALQSMQRSYELSGRPELLFNLGQLQRELGDCPRALQDYQKYLSQAPQGTRRDEAERISAELESKCPEQPAAPAAAPPAPPLAARETPPAGPTPYWTPARIGGWSSVGAAIVLAAGATYSALRASNAEGRLEDRINADQEQGTGFTSADKNVENEGQRAANWATALGVGAASLAVVGVSLIVFNPGHPAASNATISLGLSAGNAGATIHASF